MELCSLLAGAGLWDNVLLARGWIWEPSVSEFPHSVSVLFCWNLHSLINLGVTKCSSTSVPPVFKQTNAWQRAWLCWSPGRVFSLEMGLRGYRGCAGGSAKQRFQGFGAPGVWRAHLDSWVSPELQGGAGLTPTPSGLTSTEHHPGICVPPGQILLQSRGFEFTAPWARLGQCQSHSAPSP